MKKKNSDCGVRGDVSVASIVKAEELVVDFDGGRSYHRTLEKLQYR